MLKNFRKSNTDMKLLKKRIFLTFYLKPKLIRTLYCDCQCLIYSLWNKISGFALMSMALVILYFINLWAIYNTGSVGRVLKTSTRISGKTSAKFSCRNAISFMFVVKYFSYFTDVKRSVKKICKTLYFPGYDSVCWTNQTVWMEHFLFYMNNYN